MAGCEGMFFLGALALSIDSTTEGVSLHSVDRLKFFEEMFDNVTFLAAAHIQYKYVLASEFVLFQRRMYGDCCSDLLIEMIVQRYRFMLGHAPLRGYCMKFSLLHYPCLQCYNRFVRLVFKNLTMIACYHFLR